jgi:CHAT domain-containing protein
MAAWPAGDAASIRGRAATETALRKQVPGRSVIHFAVHARADEGDPLASYLELARDSSDDGFLHVSEVAALKFHGNLVVLTGCETLPGRVFAGTGPFGIANSFIAAGAKNVIATLWPVGETAAELSRDLHRALAGGADASDALRAAQLRMRRDPARAHPLYWGAYVIVAGTGR